MMVAEAAKGRELRSEGITPRGLQVPGHRPRPEKGGRTDKGHGRYRYVEWESRGKEGLGQQVEDSKGGNHRDERWRLAGGGNVHVHGLSVPRRVGGNKQVQQREVKRRQMVIDGRAVGCISEEVNEIPRARL